MGAGNNAEPPPTHSFNTVWQRFIFKMRFYPETNFFFLT